MLARSGGECGADNIQRARWRSDCLVEVAWRLLTISCKLLQPLRTKKGGREMPRTRLTAKALKKAAVLSAIAQYDEAVYGLKRLQKVVFRASKESSTKPFSYRVWHYGQHSREMTAVLRDMVRDGLVEESRLPSGTGKSYQLTEVGYSVMNCLGSVDRVLPGYGKGLRIAMKEVGLLRDNEINRWAKSSVEVKGKATGTSIFEEDLDSAGDISELSEDQVEDLELALNTGFVSYACQVIDVMRGTDLDLSAIHEWCKEASVRSSSS